MLNFVPSVVVVKYGSVENLRQLQLGTAFVRSEYVVQVAYELLRKQPYLKPERLTVNLRFSAADLPQALPHPQHSPCDTCRVRRECLPLYSFGPKSTSFNKCRGCAA